MSRGLGDVYKRQVSAGFCVRPGSHSVPKTGVSRSPEAPAPHTQTPDRLGGIISPGWHSFPGHGSPVGHVLGRHRTHTTRVHRTVCSQSLRARLRPAFLKKNSYKLGNHGRWTEQLFKRLFNLMVLGGEDCSVTFVHAGNLHPHPPRLCLLYTSDAADDTCVV